MNPRHLTPSMSLLLAFEAAARHESYTRAAEELSLSQGAISKQVQNLENQLGVKLFHRTGRTVALSEAGRRYYLDIHDALRLVRHATLQCIASDTGAGLLRLATLPTFGSKWLLPRLHRFYAAHPTITLHIHSRIGPIDFTQGEIDAAITVGTGNWHDVIAHPIQQEMLVAIASPQLVGRSTKDAAWLSTQTLLTIASHPSAWSNWFEAQQLNPSQIRKGPSFELTSHLIQAVRAGVGVGLVPLSLVSDELKRQELCTIAEPLISDRSYYLIYPARNASLASLQALKVWLLDKNQHQLKG